MRVGDCRSETGSARGFRAAQAGQRSDQRAALERGAVSAMIGA